VEIATSPSLLLRLRNAEDAEAWERFFELYSGTILAFARARGCAPHEANDVLQETMVYLLRIMPSFEYDPAKGTFRGYLFRVVDGRVKDAYRRKRHECELEEERDALRLLIDRPDEDGIEAAQWEWDRIWNQNLLLQAIEGVRKRVTASTYAAFERCVIREESGTEVAKDLNVSRDAVYKSCARFMALLRKEVADLREKWGD
jgi:RNA polymerase sigma-70 factor (ECF subfamily)